MTTASQQVIPADHVPGPHQGRWTYSHYAALPSDGKRYEIIDGVLYMAPPSPSGFHQEAVYLIATYLMMHIKFAGLGRVFGAPFDVELTPHMVVQPDVCVLLNESSDKFTPSRIIGAPDLVVEVVSPGTANYDRSTKYTAYARAGVKEYWIADPHLQTIEVLVLEQDTYHSVGVFEGKAQLRSRIVPDFPVQVQYLFS